MLFELPLPSRTKQKSTGAPRSPVVVSLAGFVPYSESAPAPARVANGTIAIIAKGASCFAKDCCHAVGV